MTPGLSRPTGLSQWLPAASFCGRERVQPPETGDVILRPAAIAIEHARRQHADDAMRVIVEQDFATENAGIAAECLLPRRMADDEDAIGAGDILVVA